MPAIDPATPTLPFKFKGRTVNIPQIVKTGDSLTENHAKFFNRQLASVTGNVLSSALARLVETKNDATKPGYIKKPDGTTYTIEDVTDTEAQAMYDAIFTRYEPGVTATRDGSSLHDPVQSIANNMAWERIKMSLKARNIKVASVKPEKKAELIGALLTRDPSILEAAKAQVASVATTEGLDDMFAGLPVGDAPAAAAPEAPANAENPAPADATPPAQDEPTVTPEAPAEATPAVEGGKARGKGAFA